jgi:hypothetical protein
MARIEINDLPLRPERELTSPEQKGLFGGNSTNGVRVRTELQGGIPIPGTDGGSTHSNNTVLIITTNPFAGGQRSDDANVIYVSSAGGGAW